MLGIDRRAARCAWTVAVVVLLLGVIYLIRRTLFVFVLALLFAYLLSPLVDLLDRALHPRRGRNLALALAYLLFLGAVVAAGSQIGSRVAEQASNLMQRLPGLLEKWEAVSATPGSLEDQILERVRGELAARSHYILDLLPKAGFKALSAATNLLYVVIIPILAFFFLKDAHLIRQHILAFVDDGPPRALLEDVLADVHLLLAHYIRALVMLSLTSFVAYGIAFSIIGVPYVVLLSALAGMLEFIPVIGPFTAAVVILIVGAVSGASVIAILIFVLVFRIFQDYVVSPQLMQRGVQLHPLLVLFGVFAGGELAGIAGTFLSVPVLALARIVYVRIRKAHAGSRLAPVETVR